ncbi:hypothetical protein ACFE04_002750 [Oxalis oulophora]
MAFGKRKRVDDNDIQSPPADIPIENIEDSSDDDDDDDGVREIKIESGHEPTVVKGKPLLSEITYIDEESKEKKSGGTKAWMCNHFAQTRFASHYVLLERLLQCREALATTVVLNAWKYLVNNGDEKMKIMTTMVASIISDEQFWEEMEGIVAFTKPLFLLIKFCDGEGSKMAEFYEKMDNMLGELKEVMQINSYCCTEMEEIVIERWAKMNFKLYCLGFALNPRFYDRTYLSKPAPGGASRKAPNKDSEVVEAVIEAFDKIYDDQEEAKLYREQFAKFHLRLRVVCHGSSTS